MPPNVHQVRVPQLCDFGNVGNQVDLLVVGFFAGPSVITETTGLVAYSSIALPPFARRVGDKWDLSGTRLLELLGMI